MYVYNYINYKLYSSREYFISFHIINHKSFISIPFMPNRKYSFIFSSVILWGNNSSRSQSSLCNLIKMSECSRKACIINETHNKCIPLL